MAKKYEPKSQLDVIAATYPRYRDLLVAQNQLFARRDALLAEAAPLNEMERRQPAFVTQAPKPRPMPVKRHEGAVALVGNLLSPQPVDEVSPRPLRPSWAGEERHRAIGRELEDISEGLALLAPELRRAREDYSKLAAAERIGKYSELADSAVDAARALGAALLEMHEFVNQARLDGIDRKYLRPINLSQFGDLGEDYSPLRRLILDAIELKHVSGGKLMDLKLPAPLDYLT